MHRHTLLTILLISVLLTACASTSAQGQSSKKQSVEYIVMTFPKEIPWHQSKVNNYDDGGMLAEWIVQGDSEQTSPIRIVYNKVVPGGNAKTFIQNVIEPIRSSCSDLKVTILPAVNKLSNQANAEVICSRMGKLGYFGTVYYITVLADSKSTHIVTSETKTIPSRKAGLLVPRDEIEKQQIDNSTILIGLMNKFRKSIRACDAQKNCR